MSKKNFEAYEGNEPYVFVSYAHKDSEKVYPIINKLHEEGYRIWYGGGMPLVIDFHWLIGNRIENCDQFIFFISPNSVASKYVLNEVENAYGFEKPILFVELEKAELPPYFITPMKDRLIMADLSENEFNRKLREPLAKCKGKADEIEPTATNQISQTQVEKFDVFISFKCTNLNGKGKTQDYELAKELFDRLRKDGVAVFFSEKDIHDSDFNTVIDNALMQSKVMIVVGTSTEHLNSGRVKYEWEHFANWIIDGKYNAQELYNYIDGMSEKDLPPKIDGMQTYTPDTKNDLISVVERHVASTPQPTSQPARDTYYRDAGSDGKLGKDTQVGDYVEFGCYPRGKDGEVEPLCWRVLDVQDGVALMITEEAIDCRLYNDKDKSQERGGNAWEFSDLRSWLNGEFLDTAFDRKERRRIAVSHNINADNPIWKTNGGNRTDDRIFCLSIDEAEKYFEQNFTDVEDAEKYLIADEVWKDILTTNRKLLSEEMYAFYVRLLQPNGDRQALATKYAESKGCLLSSMYRNTCIWWLRSSGDRSNYATHINHGGSIRSDGLDVTYNHMGVRPACRVKL